MADIIGRIIAYLFYVALFSFIPIIIFTSHANYEEVSKTEYERIAQLKKDDPGIVTFVDSILNKNGKITYGDYKEILNEQNRNIVRKTKLFEAFKQ